MENTNLNIFYYSKFEDDKKYHVYQYPNGTIYWYYNGLLHRESGPAKEYNDGRKEYYLNGNLYKNVSSDDEWLVKQIIE